MSLISAMPLRRRVLIAMMCVALSPLMFVLLSTPYEALLSRSLRTELMDVALDTPQQSISSLREHLARSHTFGAWIPREGDVIILDRGARPISRNLSSMLEPDSVQWFALWEARQPHWTERPLVDAAQPVSSALPECIVTDSSRLLVCRLAITVTMQGQPGTLYLSRGNVRHVRTLSATAVVQLCVQSLLLAMLLGVWLSRRVVKPIERLRHQAEHLDIHGTPELIVTPDQAEIGALADSFNVLLSSLHERQRDNERFAADIAHEIKNPLAAILASADNMEDGLVDAVQLEHYVGVLQRSSSRIQQLVDQFLILAKAQAGLEQVKRAPVDLHEILTLTFEAALAQPRHARVESICDVSTACVLGSAPHLMTVVEKLLENALALVDPDEGYVTLKLSVDSVSHHARLEVEDNGPGIAHDDLPHVFERFFSRREHGTGLGLPIAQAIVEAHHGTLSVSSLEGQGTCFTVMLPLLEAYTSES